MKVQLKTVRSEGSCNFCNRGVYLKDEPMEFPYTHVFNILSEDERLSIRLCKECLIELKKKSIEIEAYLGNPL